MPVGPASPVAAPPMRRSGGTLPWAVREKTRIWFASDTKISPLTASRASPPGKLSPVAAPLIVRRGATLPFAVRG
jgi:hypothetical protein